MRRFPQHIAMDELRLLLVFGLLQLQCCEGREIPGWEIGVVRRTSAYIDPHRDTTIISGRQICEHPDTKIVIVVESESTGWDFRTAIRKTWGNLTGVHVKVGFLFGFSNDDTVQDNLRNESVEFGDIVQDRFIESYYNLTLKGISILKWFTRTCPKAKFLVKADQDTYIDVPRLIQRLTKYENSTGVLRGYLCSDFDRDDRLYSKYYTPEYMYPGRKYPDFLQGSAYYMTRDVAEKLFETAMTTPIFHLEDVYITGICAKYAGVKPAKDYGVSYLFGSSISNCLTEYVITCNSVEPNGMQWLLDRFQHLNYSEEYTDQSDGSPDDHFSFDTESEPFIYVTENDTSLMKNIKKPAELNSVNVSSSAPSRESLFKVSAYITHIFLYGAKNLSL